MFFMASVFANLLRSSDQRTTGIPVSFPRVCRHLFDSTSPRPAALELSSVRIMSASDFLALYNGHQLHSLMGLEDWTDRLNSAYTVVALIFCGIIVTSETFFRRSIACHMPTVPMGSSFKTFVENYCYIEGTVALRPNESMPQTNAEWRLLHETRKISRFCDRRIRPESSSLG
ncbi:unnamed protein product [Protopolystoma xenopodis]|uniref:Innexin n=1 Tax=Protopolystoma xenopodis TaxID=117903 RepID=A0A448X3R2_9PLAT|nr:unnamed protein product [Protopolystoma xenopodis]